MLNEARTDLSAVKVDMAELEELRDFRSDIARKEKAHAELIANQAKRLEELESLYKEEQVHAFPTVSSSSSMATYLTSSAHTEHCFPYRLQDG